MARNVYTVKQVNSYIKNMFTQDFMLNRIYVKGEVSNCKSFILIPLFLFRPCLYLTGIYISH